MRLQRSRRTATGHFARTRPAIRVVLALAMTVVAASCEWVPVRTFDQNSAHAFSFQYLSRDGTDGFRSLATPGTFQVTAPDTNVGSNTRLLVYPGDQPISPNHQSCATWQSQDGINTQQGLALRVRHDVAEGRWRSITVTKNVVWGANWQFNVLTWDSQKPGWQMHGSVNLAQVFWPNQQLAPLPWRVCARVEGDLVRVKGWRVGQTEPAWNNNNHTGTVRLPMEWVYPGKAGWYVGHLAPGHSTTMVDLVLARLDAR